MNRTKITLAAAAALLFFSGAARAVDFSYGFVCPGPIRGNPGEVKTFDVFGTLTVANNTDTLGPQGWSVSMEVQGATLLSNVLKGVEVNTIFFDDLDDSTDTTDDIERKDPYLQDLGAPDMFTKVIARATLPEDTNRKGIISAIVMKGQEKQVLQPNGTSNIFKLTLEVTIPADGSETAVNLKYMNGFKSTQSQPTPNVVTYEVPGSGKGPESFPPQLNGCTIPVGPIGKEFNLALIGPGQTPAPDGDTILDVGVPAPGPVIVPVDVLLTTINLPPGDGPQGWSLSIRHDPCMTVDKPLLKGVEVSTIFYDDLDDSTDTTDDIVKKDPYIQDLGAADMFTKVVAKASGADPSPLPDEAQGVISAVIMKSQEKQVLHANSSDAILRINYLIDVVEGQTTNCRAYFQNGLKSTQSQPTPNVITFSPEDVVMSFAPTKQQGIVIRASVKLPEVDEFVRGDPNDDQKFDIADAVAIILNVVPGIAGPNDVVVRCKDSMDVDGTNSADVADAVYLINYQFRAGPPPVAPFPACARSDASTPESCPANSHSCTL